MGCLNFSFHSGMMFHRLYVSFSARPRLTFAGLLLAGVAVVPMARAAIVTDPKMASAPVSSMTPALPAAVDPDETKFAANTVSYDEPNQIITAEGDVEIEREGRIVRAKKVVYNLPKDTVEAVGDVVLMDVTGDVHFADRAELERKMKDGYIKTLRSVLADGSRITAAEGRKKGTRTVMRHASYTPCEECKAHPEKPVLWKIVADKVTHNADKHAIEYRDAKFEIYDVPVFYTPYFSHSDGTIKQESGLLPPKFSLNSQLGFGVTSLYYWGISPSEDATIGAKFFSKNTPQLLAGYRKRYDQAELDFEGSAIDSDTDPKTRGHLFGKGLWEIDDKWRAGFLTELTSDDKYLREYDISGKNVLENQIYAERFDDRDYFVTRALAFQDVRVSNRSTDQPNILPEAQYTAMGRPNGLLGGRWNVNLSSLTLVRKGNGQDVFRNSGEASWQRRDVLPIGLVNTFNISSRGDIYQISDRDETSLVGGSGGAKAFRFYPLVHDMMSYPVAKNMGSSQMIIEPTIAFTAASATKNDTGIPNEDSQDVQLDATNIFDANRFPGLDRVEDGSHVTYGARTGIYADDGSKGEIFLGQSHRLDSQGNPFPDGSGLSEQKSDVVGQLVAQYEDLYGINYRTQLASDNWQSERHELDGFANLGNLSLSTTYLYARNLDGTDLQTSRQQIYGAATYKFDPEWSLRTAARYDLSDTQKGLRSTDVGLNYIGQCFNILTTVKRSFTYDNTGNNATEFMVQLGFKNLGTFGTNQK